MRLYLIDDRVPRETIELLVSASDARGVEAIVLAARAFDFTAREPVAPDEMLYRPAVSLAAIRVEQYLAASGAATFYRDRDGAYFVPTAAAWIFERAGLSVPRSLPCVSRDRGVLRRSVDNLGGYPVVVKVPGGEGGVGVMLAESSRSLFALVDHLLEAGRTPWLSAFVDDAEHWRVIVVGDTAVAAYRNPIEVDDFRSVASEDPAEVTAAVPADLAALAAGAAAALRVETAGVDILRHPSGRLYLLEANFPCFFGHAQRVAGIDIAGRMVDHLSNKARAS